METQARPGQYLTFTLAQNSYGVPIGSIREINRVTEITPVPQTPPFMSGVINLRGKVIPVVDLRVKLGLPEAQHTKETCIIVIEGDHGQIGMIVDAVRGVVDLNAAQIEPAPVLGEPNRLGFVIGMGKIDDSVLVLMDIVQALSKEQLSQVFAITAVNAAAAERKAV